MACRKCYQDFSTSQRFESHNPSSYKVPQGCTLSQGLQGQAEGEVWPQPEVPALPARNEVDSAQEGSAWVSISGLPHCQDTDPGCHQTSTTLHRGQGQGQGQGHV